MSFFGVHDLYRSSPIVRIIQPIQSSSLAKHFKSSPGRFEGFPTTTTTAATTSNSNNINIIIIIINNNNKNKNKNHNENKNKNNKNNNNNNNNGPLALAGVLVVWSQMRAFNLAATSSHSGGGPAVAFSCPSRAACSEAPVEPSCCPAKDPLAPAATWARHWRNCMNASSRAGAWISRPRARPADHGSWCSHGPRPTTCWSRRRRVATCSITHRSTRTPRGIIRRQGDFLRCGSTGG